MAELVWDQVGKRFYEAGIDRGVLYMPDGTAVPWNGLTAVVEKFDSDSETVYYDGRKINKLTSFSDFSASLRAYTYPEEFLEVEGVASVRSGLTLTGQRPSSFGLAYRTKAGNDLGEENYKLTLIYNATAVPKDRSYSTISDDPSFTEFEWDIDAIPQDVTGYRPTAQLVLDSRRFDPLLLDTIEQILYGTEFEKPRLIPMEELFEFISTWSRYTVVDNGDGTWTATTSSRNGIKESRWDPGAFEIIGINTTWIDEDTYTISDTPYWPKF